MILVADDDPVLLLVGLVRVVPADENSNGIAPLDDVVVPMPLLVWLDVNKE